MKSAKFFILFLILAACTAVPPASKEVKPSSNQFLENAAYCNVDSDCICGGHDKNTQNCFVGNKLYASKNVDMSQDCPDFCTGIAGNFETKCVNNVCKNVKRVTSEAAPPAEQVMCTQDAKECPDGSYVARSGPNCEFAPCPASAPPSGGLSSAHWLCEDTSWKSSPEGCFENVCVQKSDCQLMGVKGACGPYMIGGPTKSLHKPPVFYADRCGEEPCSPPDKACNQPPQTGMTGFDCVNSRCVVRYGEKFY